MLPQSDTEAFLWAQKAAEAGLAKAMYAVGYFLEVGIGTPANPSECVLFPYFLQSMSAILMLSQWDKLVQEGCRKGR